MAHGSAGSTPASGEISGAPKRCIMCMSVAVIGLAKAGAAKSESAAAAASRLCLVMAARRSSAVARGKS